MLLKCSSVYYIFCIHFYDIHMQKDSQGDSDTVALTWFALDFDNLPTPAGRQPCQLPPSLRIRLPECWPWRTTGDRRSLRILLQECRGNTEIANILSVKKSVHNSTYIHNKAGKIPKEKLIICTKLGVVLRPKMPPRSFRALAQMWPSINFALSPIY